MMRTICHNINDKLEYPIRIWGSKCVIQLRTGIVNLAGDPSYTHIVEEMQTALLAQWDPVAIDRQVRQSQCERLLIERAHGLR